MQAALASDFSIGRFYFLEKLVLVHGGWNYYRMAKLIYYMLYKNLLLAFLQLFASSFDNFSGQSIYNSVLGQLFGLFFTRYLIPTLLYPQKKNFVSNQPSHPSVECFGPESLQAPSIEPSASI
jgi:magnesium-transporting ATPase (P-type)